jgi:hypothetical protein
MGNYLRHILFGVFAIGLFTLPASILAAEPTAESQDTLAQRADYALSFIFVLHWRIGV